MQNFCIIFVKKFVLAYDYTENKICDVPELYPKWKGKFRQQQKKDGRSLVGVLLRDNITSYHSRDSENVLPVNVI